MYKHLKVHQCLTDILGIINRLLSQILGGHFYGLTKGLSFCALNLCKDIFYFINIFFH